jgi:hypothetical protein
MSSKVLLSKNKKQYKANLHCHSNRSDGKLSPEELKALYKANGYDILAITDHCNPKDHSSLNDEDFMFLTGYEAYIRPDASGKSNIFAPEVHLNLFARDPKNEALVCYNEKYTKYIPKEKHGELCRVGSERTREYTVEYINEFIQAARDNGYLVSYNHPCWSMEDESTIMSYEGIFSMEMCNYGSYILNATEYNSILYNKMLNKGMRVFCHSTDDNHNKAPDDSVDSDSFGGFTMIMPKEFTYDSVIEAMETGEMYSSMGPLFKEVSMDGNKIHIECSDVKMIVVFTGGKSPKHIIAEDGTTVNCADFEIDDRAKYVRVSIMDNHGKYADTRGYFRDELEF